MDVQLNSAGAKVLEIAKKEAGSLCNRYAGTEHLLLGILTVKEATIIDIFKKMKIDVKDIKQVIYDNIYSTSQSPVDNKKIEFTPRVTKILHIAKECAEKLGRNKIGVEHIFLGLLYEQNGVAVNVLKSFGVSFRRVKREFHKQIDGMIKVPERGATDIIDIQSFKTEFKKYKALSQFGINLTLIAKQGKMDTVVGRESEVNRLMQILCRKTKNNPVLVGDAGVGKTAIVELLAQKIANNDVPDQLVDKHVVKIDMASIVAGTKYRGQFEERMKKILDEIKDTNEIIVFVDEIHTIIDAGAASGSLDAGNILKPALSRGEMTCIGATTPQEYVKYIESDKALERRFQTIDVDAPTADEALTILKGIKNDYEKYHGVKYSVGALRAAIELSERYIVDRKLPDSAIDIIDEVGAKHSLEKNKNIITEEEIEMLVSNTTGIPIMSLDNNTTKFFRFLERSLKKNIIGQQIALQKVCSSLKRAHAHLNDPNQPVGTFLFLGTTGVGKTHLCKLLAKYLFGSDQRMVRLDMSEYMESHSVSKLTGSPPGYVGHDDTNNFVETVRKYPYSLVLFDEIEKAHPQVLNLLLQILDEGHLTDSHGRKINFKNTVIVMTSNLGTSLYDTKKIGFVEESDEEKHIEVKDAAVKQLPPEFVNRIDEIIVFNRLGREDLRQIIKIQFDIFAARVKEHYKIKILYDNDILDFFIKEDDTRKYGARQIKRNFRKHVENELAELFVSKKFSDTDIRVYLDDDKVAFKPVNSK